MKLIKKIPRGRTLDEVRRHYEAEKSIAQKLLRSSREQRVRMYPSIYDELFEKVPEHPRLRAHLDAAQMHKRNLQKLSLIESFVTSSSTVAEFAPGDCLFATFLCSRVKDVYAFDISDQSLGEMQRPSNFHFVVYDGYRLDKAYGPFDIIFSDQFIEHLHPDDVGEHISLAYSLLKPGGRYILRAPHRFLGPHDVSKYFSRRAEGFHLCEPAYTDLIRYCCNAGFGTIIVHRGKIEHYKPVPIGFFIAFEWVVNRFPLAMRKFFSRPVLPRQLYLIANKPLRSANQAA